jgi:hypothetical protein
MNIHYLTDRLPGPNYNPLETDANYRTEFGAGLNDSVSKSPAKKKKEQHENSVSDLLKKSKLKRNSIIQPSKISTKTTCLTFLERVLSKSPLKVSKDYLPREISRERSRNLPSLKAGKKRVGRNPSKELLLSKGGNHKKLEKVSTHYLIGHSLTWDSKFRGMTP